MSFYKMPKDFFHLIRIGNDSYYLHGRCTFLVVRSIILYLPIHIPHIENLKTTKTGSADHRKFLFVNEVSRLHACLFALERLPVLLI